MISLSLYEYIEAINQMLEEAKDETDESNYYLDDLNDLFLTKD